MWFSGSTGWTVGLDLFPTSVVLSLPSFSTQPLPLYSSCSLWCWLPPCSATGAQPRAFAAQLQQSLHHLWQGWEQQGLQSQGIINPGLPTKTSVFHWARFKKRKTRSFSFLRVVQTTSQHCCASWRCYGLTWCHTAILLPPGSLEFKGSRISLLPSSVSRVLLSHTQHKSSQMTCILEVPQ